MSNPNPRTEHLVVKRGRRPRLDNKTVAIRLSAKTRGELEKIAASYNCFYADKPWIAGLLEHIGSGHLSVVPSPPYQVEHEEIDDLKKGALAYMKRVVEKR
jgi:hypothetical protein